MKTEHFYSSQPDSAFWSRAVSAVHIADLGPLWPTMDLVPTTRIATAGSCFAQHIGIQLNKRGAHVLDLEPPPPIFVSDSEARRWGFGLYSCRYGNIYTTRQLVQLFDEAHGNRIPVDRIWERNGRFYDALRPGIDPVGQDSPETILRLRDRHLAAVRSMFSELGLFIFTLGLTEGWESTVDGTIYPSAPGSIAGKHDPAAYELRNLRYPEVGPISQASGTAYAASIQRPACC